MPYCEPCARHWTPTSMNPDGSCPSCGEVLAAPTRPARPVPKAPWHFKVLLASLAVYLGWRAFQGIAWVAGHL